MLKLVVLITAIRLLMLSSCVAMPSTMSKRSNVQICGRMLAQTLNLLCEGQYYDPGEQSNDISKREVAQQMMDDYYPGWYMDLPWMRTNKITHYNYNQYRPQSPFNRRQEGGVVDECCKKPCPVTVLMSYCRSN